MCVHLKKTVFIYIYNACFPWIRYRRRRTRWYHLFLSTWYHIQRKQTKLTYSYPIEFFSLSSGESNRFSIHLFIVCTYSLFDELIHRWYILRVVEWSLINLCILEQKNNRQIEIFFFPMRSHSYHSMMRLMYSLFHKFVNQQSQLYIVE
jgi:hypothetical protein